ncbi:MAG: tRNA (guanine(10)-N(2))-dimethyltransferase [Methanotrichaceae archaeon]
MSLVEEGAITFESDGIFYNPRMKLNRDICVAMVKSLGITDYLDALSASGIRGLRAAKEANAKHVTLNDVSHQAYEVILKNIARNNALNCEALCSNANVLMHQRHFQAVDLDPFGSPSPYLSAGSRSALSYLFITATDTAPLCGAHLKSGIRKYMAMPLNTDYHPEMGARILLGMAARELARLDKSMEPILTHVTDHYVRLYLQVRKGARLADKCLENMGYVEHCTACGCFICLREPKFVGTCSACGCKTVFAGPLWLGRIQEATTIHQAIASLGDGNARALRLLETCASEVDTPLYYDHHSICERLKITPSKIDAVVEYLLAAGWKASRTHFSGIGIKTDACIWDVEAAVKCV